VYSERLYAEVYLDNTSQFVEVCFW